MDKKKSGVYIIAGVFALLLIVTLPGKQGLISLYKNHLRYEQQSEELIRAHQVIDSLKTEIVRLRSDTGYIEKIARERLGMAKRNEKVFKFVDDDKDSLTD